MADLKKYAKRKRNENLFFAGCLTIMGLFGTGAFLIGMAHGQTKFWILVFSPIFLLLAPVFWLSRQRKLENALQGRTPASVLTFYLEDIQDALSETAAPEFAYNFTVSTARSSDQATFALALRQPLLDVFNKATNALVVNGRCDQCGSEQPHVVPDLHAALHTYRMHKDAEIALRCKNCQRIYCNACAGAVLRDEDKIFKPMRCVCESVLATSHDKLILRNRLRNPVMTWGHEEWSGSDDSKVARINAQAAYCDTGLQRIAKFDEKKPVRFVAADVTISVPFRQIEGRWMVTAPFEITHTEPPKKRWTDT